MDAKSATQFALWLAKDQPQLFAALAKAASPGKELGDFWDTITSGISAAGSAISSAASNVGTYLTSAQGMDTLTKLGSVYLQTQAQKTAVDTQAKLAAMNRAPAPIQTVLNPATGQYEAVLTTQTVQGTYQQPLTPSLASKLTAGLPSWWPFAAVGLLGVVFLLLRRR